MLCVFFFSLKLSEGIQARRPVHVLQEHVSGCPRRHEFYSWHSKPSFFTHIEKNLLCENSVILINARFLGGGSGTPSSCSTCTETMLIYSCIEKSAVPQSNCCHCAICWVVKASAIYMVDYQIIVHDFLYLRLLSLRLSLSLTGERSCMIMKSSITTKH